MYISLQTKQAYTEIDNFIELLTKEDRNKIPETLRKFFKEEKDPNYIKSIDVKVPIKDQNLKQETLALIALLNIKYICDDADEKDRLMKIYRNNNIKYQETLKEKYNVDNLFKNKKNISEKTSITEYKKMNFILKFLNKIKNLFRKN